MGGQMTLYDFEGIENLITEEAPLSEDEEVIRAKMTYEVFLKKENGYGVYTYTDVDTKKRITCVGYYLPSNKKITYLLRGKYTNNPRFGLQFEITSYTESIKKGKESIIEYLSSGIIKGIGPATAQKIYKAFGDDTISTLDTNIDSLSQIKGISKKKLNTIKESYMENRCARDLITYGIQLGLTPSLCLKLFREYSYQALRYLRENPYELTRKTEHFSFVTADRIARMQNLPLNSNERFEAALRYVYTENAAQKGSLGFTVGDLGDALYRTLNSEETPGTYINEKVIEYIKKGILKIRYVKVAGEELRCIFRAETLDMEEKTAEYIKTLMEEGKQFIYKEKDLEKFLSGTTLDNVQKSAVKCALDNPLSIITGGPGTGKTTLINALIEFYESHTEEKEVILLAPTGRAARRMNETTGHSATTIHSRLKMVGYDEFGDDDLEFKDCLLIIDEWSMVDSFIAFKLLSHVTPSCKVVVVGDPDQLPSVGPGAVLRDMLDTHYIPSVKLDKVYRQSEENNIFDNIKLIRDGQPALIGSNSFKLYQSDNIEEIERFMIKVVADKVRKYGLENVYCLCPFRKHAAGINRMNKALQDVLNPANSNKAEFVFRDVTYREGDPVMHLKNEPDASNGDIGIITRITNEDGIVTFNVKINGIDKEYEKKDLEKLELAYAMTVHKSQGSEASCVVTCLSSFHKQMLVRNIPYTAFSRAKDEVVFIGDKEALKTAIMHEALNKRITYLGHVLTEYAGEFIRIA